MASTLKTYNAKRDFKKSAEPKGKKGATQGRGFVVQKHDASRMHYDFRLELDGVLKSWAVPKGPSLDPKQRRLAVHVEDHPVAYGTFEGTIPKGEYGGGTVMVWDRGDWEMAGDESKRKAYESGKLKFVLHGEKLRGMWNLVRMGGDAGEDGKNWLLIKENDDEARKTSKFDVVEELADSVASGRSLEQIANANGKVWTSKKKSAARSANGKTRKKAARKAKVPNPAHAVADLPLTKKAPLPKEFSPQLATLVKTAPAGDDWIHEVKFDGYRIVCIKNGDKVNLISRNAKDWTSKFKSIAEAAILLPVDQVVLDGEIVVPDSKGHSSFQLLQNAFKTGKSADFQYYVFDLPYCEGYDLSKVPLIDRKTALSSILGSSEEGRILFSDHILGNGGRVYEKACRMSLEGVVSKKANATYEHRRTKSWVKTKCSRRQEFVIGGYTKPGGARNYFGALLLGYYENDELRYAGKVGTGFNEESLKQIHSELKKRERKTSPFAAKFTGAELRRTHWVEPTLVGEVEFFEWTGEGSLRHPSFQGLREDVAPKSVKREAPTAVGLNGTDDPPAKVTKAKKTPAPIRQAKSDAVAGVRLTNPDRVLYPDSGLTKLDLARFYEEIAEWVLPHVIKRPLSVVRCPDGQTGACFYQKHVSDSLPPAIRGIEIQEKKKKDKCIIIDDLAGLISLVQVGVLEIHPWGSKEGNIETPDLVNFDLDPDPGVSWPEVVKATRELHAFLDDLGLTSFVKTSGGKGLHIVVPLTPRANWDEAKEFAKAVAEHFATADPKRYIATMSKAKRKGKIFIDYLRNARGQTSVAAYSTRARPGAPVSTPIRWDELSASLNSTAFGVENLPRRLAKLKGDPWEGYFKTRQSITVGIRKKLGSF